MFFNQQIEERKERYVSLLSCVGALSKLFSENDKPYLHYRAHEILFNYAFGANDISRGDISFDATKDGLGIGLKTFLHGNGATFQKVAEFSSVSEEIRALKNQTTDIVHFVAEMRNQRLTDTQIITDTSDMIYHAVTREKAQLNIVESSMNFIDLSNIRNIAIKKNNIHFDDRIHEYNFSLAKNTLFKKFITRDRVVHSFPVKINPNPFDLLGSFAESSTFMEFTDVNSDPFVVLPLYSVKDGEVQEKSGLNQWNAGGRKRGKLEVYVSIPAWIHKELPDFFNYDPSDKKGFNVKLPNSRIIACKVCQQGGKALMSNPNSVLGEWLIKEVLRLPEEVVISRDDLRKKDIDSILLTKVNKVTHTYEMNFLKFGSYDEFEQNTKIAARR